MTTPSLWNQIKGHDSIRESLDKAISSGRPPHGLLFSGPSGVGKKKMALAWAQALLCTEKKPPCGVCNACKRVASGNHPDLLLLTPDGASIKIEQIRQVQQFCSLKSYEGKGKVVVIDDAHLMGPQAGNALLKTLEEPPEKTYFVLVTPQKGAVLTTIQSRTQKAAFGALSSDQIREITSASDWVLALAGGRADVALKLQDPTWSALRKKALTSISDLFTARTFEGFQSMTELHEERENALFAVQCWLNLVGHALSEKLGARPAAVAPDEKPLIEKLNKSASIGALERLGQKLLQLEQDIVHNVHKALAFEQFWLEAKHLTGKEKP